MKKEYKFSGSTGGRSTVTIDNDRLIIKRKGITSFFNHGLAGEKTFYIPQITGTQFKKAGLSSGYLQFLVVGSQESKKGGIHSANADENTVSWIYKKQNAYAEEIIKYINDFNSSKENESIKQEDKYDKLKKIHQLFTENIIDKEEFEKEKEKILNQE